MFDFKEQFVEIRFPQGVDNFLKVKETLTRIGVASYNDEQNTKTLWQSCHILYKQNRFWIVHFKEMFLLDGKFHQTVISKDDLARRNAIALLLEQWGLVEIVSKAKCLTPSPASIASIKVIPFKEKQEWQLKAKYEIGKQKK